MARDWTKEAMRRIEADFNRSADTHLLRLDLAAFPGITLYLKDESTHPTGSLKHRLARSLFLHGLCNGWIREGTLLVEASSGSTAISEAYFARLLGLSFLAVMPRSTSTEKIALIEFQGGRCHLVDDPAEVYHEAARLAEGEDGHYLDQFTNAERATDWRGNNNIAQAIFEEMAQEPSPIPAWIVVGAGTGGTSATIGRYLRYRRLDTQLLVVDPENSVFLDYHRTGDRSLTNPRGSRIEGIGRPRVEPSFVPEIVDRMTRVADPATFAGMRVLGRLLGRQVGASTGTNFVGALELMTEMRRLGQPGSVVTLLCDGGERYANTLASDSWLAEQGIALDAEIARLNAVIATGEWVV